MEIKEHDHSVDIGFDFDSRTNQNAPSAESQMRATGTVLSDSCRMSVEKERQAGEIPAKERKLRKDKRRLCMCVTHRCKKSSSVYMRINR